MVTNSELDKLEKTSYGVIVNAHELNATTTHTLDKTSYGVILIGQHGSGGSAPAVVNNFFSALLMWCMEN